MTCEWVLSCPISESRRLRDRADGGGQGGTNNSSTSSARHFRGLSLPFQNHLPAHEQPGQSGLGETLSESEKIGQTETRRVVRAVATPHNRHARHDCSPLAAMFRVAREKEATESSLVVQPSARSDYEALRWRVLKFAGLSPDGVWNGVSHPDRMPATFVSSAPNRSQGKRLRHEPRQGQVPVLPMNGSAYAQGDCHVCCD